MTPFDYVKIGDVNYFKTAELSVLQSYRDGENDPILSVAAMENQFECCQEIYRRCPSQLFCVNVHGNTILHHVAYYGGDRARMLEYFLEIGAKAKTEDEIENGESTRFRDWVDWRNKNGETAMCRGFHLRNCETTKSWIKAENDHKLDLLSMTNNDGDTPLHLAVKYQDLELVKLLVTEPEHEFEYNANKDDETPLLIAIRAASKIDRDNTPVKIRTLLLEKQPKQCKVRVGQNRWTPLHYATSEGDVDLIKYIIQFCPDCMQVGDIEGKSFLHLAVKHQLFDVVKNVTEKDDDDISNILNQKDNYGNTPLHIAAETGNTSILKSLLDHGVGTMARNAKGQKASDLIFSEIGKLSDFDLVVSALIASVSFTAGITVPGGYIGEGPNSGMALLLKHRSFEVFAISNNVALVLSLSAVFINFGARRLLDKKRIAMEIGVAALSTVVAIIAMMVAFMAGSYAVLASPLALIVCIYSSIFLIFVITFSIVVTANAAVSMDEHPYFLYYRREIKNTEITIYFYVNCL